MKLDAVTQAKPDPTGVDPRRHAADSSVAKNPLPAKPQTDEPPDSIRTFEGFLEDVERCVQDAGQLLLFSGDQLRLDVMLLRHEKNPRVIWGLKRHEDWAFKATLLRFARGHYPVHLILTTEKQEAGHVKGWVVQRTLDAFWASPLPAERAFRFWERCQSVPDLMKASSTDIDSM